MNWRGCINAGLLVAITAACLLRFLLHHRSIFFRQLEASLVQTQSLLLVCLTVWCGTFLFLAFSPKDVCLIGLLLIAAGAYFIGNEWQGTDVATLFFGITLSRGTGFALKARSQESEVRSFFVCLILLLAFASLWHLDMRNNFYHGPRWMGLWNNPNIYGVLMGAGWCSQSDSSKAEIE